MTSWWRSLLCFIGRHDVPRFTRVEGRQMHQCPDCDATWPVLPDATEHFRPEHAIAVERAHQQVMADRARRAAAPSDRVARHQLRRVS